MTQTFHWPPWLQHVGAEQPGGMSVDTNTGDISMQGDMSTAELTAPLDHESATHESAAQQRSDDYDTAFDPACDGVDALDFFDEHLLSKWEDEQVNYAGQIFAPMHAAEFEITMSSYALRPSEVKVIEWLRGVRRNVADAFHEG